MNVLALSGSLRAASINTAFCRAAAQLAPPTMHVTVFAGLGELPLFNPDLEAQRPATVHALYAAVDSADALLIASPEYAHGISGVLKNALDWLVSFEGLVYKPIALINTSARAHHADDSLREVLRTMSTLLVDEASIGIPLLGHCMTEDSMLASPEASAAIRARLLALGAYLGGHRATAPRFPLV